MNVNSQYFDKKQIESGEMQKLLNFLMSSSYGKGDTYNDIHIVPADLDAFIVEWVQVPWSHDYGGKFQYVDEDETIMIERSFPDRHYEYFHDEEEYQEALNDWLAVNPGWVRTEYGTWTNEIENAKFRKELGLDVDEDYVDEFADDEDSVDQDTVDSVLCGLDENGMPQ